MTKLNDTIDYVLITIGLAISVENIESILGIIILVVQLVWFIIKLIVKIYNNVKKGKSIIDFVNDVDEEVKEINSTIEEIKEKVGDNNNE